jgi:uncharacterized protein YdeI (YjbR/CyaY-like superfamily)
METLEVHNRREWRAWLARRHASSEGVWLVYHKGPLGAKSIAYEDSVREALCFGWIDSLIKRVDDDRYVRKFTPRKPGSKWSDSNRTRWAELEKAGLLAEAGLAAAPTGNRESPPPLVSDPPDDLARALTANPEARTFFEGLAQRERCRFATWVHMAKRPETRERRIGESIALLAAGKKLGLK